MRAWEVVGHQGKAVIAGNSQGEERRFTAKPAKAFDVYQRSKIEIAPNEKLLLENRREPGFRAVNGELVTVSAVDEKQRNLAICKMVAYCRRTTSNLRMAMRLQLHRSQSKSVDHVIISADGMRRQAFYFAASPGRERLTVVTTDKERLSESVACSDHRQSAHELVLHRGGAGAARGRFTQRDAQLRSVSGFRDSGATSSMNAIRDDPDSASAQQLRCPPKPDHRIV